MGFGESFGKWFGTTEDPEITRRKNLEAELARLQKEIALSLKDPDYAEKFDLAHLQRRIDQIKEELGIK